MHVTLPAATQVLKQEENNYVFFGNKVSFILFKLNIEQETQLF